MYLTSRALSEHSTSLTLSIPSTSPLFSILTNDIQLLLKVLETHNITIDTKAVHASWPTDKGEVPSPRAITERVLKIRSLAKATGGGTFSVKSSQSRSLGATKPKSSATPTTPKKARAKTGSGAKNGTEEYASGGKKRGRTGVAVKLEEGSEEEALREENGNWLMQDEESPCKKTRVMHVEIANGQRDMDAEVYGKDLYQEDV